MHIGYQKLRLPLKKFKKKNQFDNIVCRDGEYISNKTCVDCPGHCKDGAQCDKLTGLCDNGCAKQWTGTFCHSLYFNRFFFNCQLSNTNRLLMLINLDSCQLIQRLLNQTAFYKKCIGRNSKEFSR